MAIKILVLTSIIFFLLTGYVPQGICANIKLSATVAEQQPLVTKLGSIYVGMTKKSLYKIFSKEFEKDYRKENNKEWITFSDWTTEAVLDDLITFYIMDKKVVSWFEGSISDISQDTTSEIKADMSVQPKIPDSVLQPKLKTDMPNRGWIDIKPVSKPESQTDKSEGGWVNPVPIKSNEK